MLPSLPSMAVSTALPSRIRSCCTLSTLSSRLSSLSLTTTTTTSTSTPTSSSSSRRGFHTTTPALAKDSKKRLEHILEKIPPYPYPIRRTFKQAWFGLYGGKHIQFGNNVPESNRARTRRDWHPNILKRRIWSPALNEFIHTRVAASVLRTIDKAGGLDEYLVGSEKPARLRELGPFGWKLRFRVLQTKWAREKFAQQRREFGLPEREKVGKEKVDRTQLPLGLEVANDRAVVSPFADKLGKVALIRAPNPKKPAPAVVATATKGTLKKAGKAALATATTTTTVVAEKKPSVVSSSPKTGASATPLLETEQPKQVLTA